MGARELEKLARQFEASGDKDITQGFPHGRKWQEQEVGKLFPNLLCFPKE